MIINPGCNRKPWPYVLANEGGVIQPKKLCKQLEPVDARTSGTEFKGLRKTSQEHLKEEDGKR